MDTDIELTCVDCDVNFWWTVPEQARCEDRGLAPPKRCRKCRAARKKSRSAKTSAALIRASNQQSTALAPVSPQLPALPELPPEFTDRAALFNDIQQLLWEAAAPIEDRQRNFLEWWQGVDLRAEQLARKMQAASDADELVQQRTTLFEHLQQMIAAATNAELARLRAHVALQQEQLLAIELHEQIQQRRALAAETFVTLQLTERAKQKKLGEAFVGPEKRDEGEIAVEEHRKKLRLHAKAGQAVISDFLSAIEEICESRYSIQEKSLRIRKVLDVFQMGEDELPRRAREILEASEVVR